MVPQWQPHGSWGEDEVIHRKCYVSSSACRALLLVFIVLAFAFAWVSYTAQSNRAQRHAIERIWRLGGHVVFEGERDWVRPLSEAEWSSELNRNWIHDSFVTRTPTQVLFANAVGYPTDVSDDDVDELIDVLRKLPTIQSVRLDATTITENGVRKLQAELPGVYIWKPEL